MPQVNVEINGTSYRMACEDGQEKHLLALAERFNATVGSLKGSFGEIGDQRLTVMAGVMVSDELVEAERKIAQLEADIDLIRKGAAAESGLDFSASDETLEVIQRLTETVRATTSRLRGAE